MIEATTLIDDVKGEFEGGNSLAVDWDTLIRRAVENVLDNARPETLKRRVPIYGGLAHEVYAYYCPDDVLVPSDLYTNDGLRKFKYVAPKAFHSQMGNNTYTIEYINGARFILVRHALNLGSLTIDAMDAVGTKTGGSPRLNSHNFLVGSGSVEATFTDAGVEFGDNPTTALDLTDYIYDGVVILPMFLRTGDASKISSLELRFKTDDSNYYKLLMSTDNQDDYLVDGWNMVKFQMQGKTTEATPDVTDITEWSIIGTTTTGNSVTVIFDKFTIQKFNPYYFEYYSSAPFVNGSTGSKWQTSIVSANNDKINFNRDVAGILHYELCMLVVQSSTFENVDSQASRRFEGQLQRKYQAYWATHPSSESPVSYSKSPEIDISQDTDYGRIQDTTESIE